MILHLSGRDGPGITAALSQTLAQNEAQLIDLGQAVLHDFLNLSAIVDVPKSSSLIKELMVLAQSRHLKFDILPYDGTLSYKASSNRFCLTMLGQLSSEVVAQITQELASKSLNLREIKTLSNKRLEGLELLCEAPGATNFDDELSKLKEHLYKKSASLKCDISLQKDTIYRRNRRLIVFDVDSTFIPFEIVDELGKLVGKGEEIAKITERAMQGELDFKKALEERVKLLKGLSLESAKRSLSHIKPNPGVEKLIKILRTLGRKVGLVSGGFDFFVTELRTTYGLDFSFANHLKVENGIFTGEIEGQIVDAQRKAQILSDMCEAYQCQLEQSIAVGDGSNDVEMLKIAGLGIAYQGKLKAQQAADVSFNHTNLADILYLMGFHADEFETIA